MSDEKDYNAIVFGASILLGVLVFTIMAILSTC